MSQGAIYRSRDGKDLLCRVQTDLGLETAMILYAPVMPRSAVQNAIPKLYIPCEINGESHLIIMSELIALPPYEIGDVVDDAKDKRDAIIAAVDLLVMGF